MDLSKLKDVFPPEDIEWRVQSSGEKNSKPWALVLAYITNRAIMDRFDEVCGPENWKNEFTAAPSGGTLCGLSVKIAGEWVTKWDGAENTDIEAVKGGLSNAMKRSAVQWGVGRYLYNLTTGWAVISENGSHRDKTKTGTQFKWNPPALPPLAVPKGTEQQKPPQSRQDVPQAPEDDIPDFPALITEDQKKAVGVLLDKLSLPLDGLEGWLVEKNRLAKPDINTMTKEMAAGMLGKWDEISADVTMFCLNRTVKT